MLVGLTSIFYIAFLVAEAPGNYILQRVSVGPTIAVSMFIWGILVFCIAAAKNFASLMVLRFLQGAAECTTYPALIYITVGLDIDCIHMKTIKLTLRSQLSTLAKSTPTDLLSGAQPTLVWTS